MLILIRVLISLLCLVFSTYSWANTPQKNSAEEGSTPNEALVTEPEPLPPFSDPDATEPDAKGENIWTAMEFKLPVGLTWESNDQDPIFADPKAQKGGVFKSFIFDFPVTFRQVGPHIHSSPIFATYLNAQDMSLISTHPNTGNIVPALATHWAVSADNKTVYYKLNPEARYSDGKPVVADDYVFTLEFMKSPYISSPEHNDYYSKEISDVSKHSEQVISVVSAKPHIKSALLRKTSLSPTPKHFYKLNKNWLKNYNGKVKPNTGAYQISDFRRGKFVTFKRKKDWWAKDLKYYKHSYNMDEIHLKVIRDVDTMWQSFIKGELSAFRVSAASWWHEKAKGKVFDKGYIKKLWFYHKIPSGANMVWLNELIPIWHDKNVRYAFAHSLNFKKLNEDLLHGESQRLHSFYTGYSDYDNPSIKARTYDVSKAAEYMKKSGYSQGEEGIWQKDGNPLQITLSFHTSYHRDYLELLKKEARKSGFDISLERLDNTTGPQKLREKTYTAYWIQKSQITYLPPQYEDYFHSKNTSYNLTLSKDPDLDKLIEQYQNSFQHEEKTKLSREILQKIHQMGSFIPGFHYPFHRYLHWHPWKFPQVAGTKREGLSLWLMWYDVEAAQELEKSQKSGTSLANPVTIDTTYK